MIQNNPAETALVIAGAWNPAILPPEWVLRHGLERQGDERVQVLLPVGAGIIFEFPRYTLGDFSYVVRPDALIIAPPETTEDRVKTSEIAMVRMLEILRHTPVTGLGHNFEFRDDAPDPRYVAIFSAARQDLVDEMPEGWEPASTNITSSFQNKAGNIVINITRTLDAGVIVVKFNFHHVINSIDQVLQVLRGEDGYARMWANYDTASQLMQALYGEENGN